jgi:hypothetical protein
MCVCKGVDWRTHREIKLEEENKRFRAALELIECCWIALAENDFGHEPQTPEDVIEKVREIAEVALSGKPRE